MSSTEKSLVSTEWLEANMQDPNIRIVESNEDPLLYFDSHIKGAVHVDWTNDLNDPLRRDYLSKEEFEKLAPKKALPMILIWFFMAIKITGGQRTPFGFSHCSAIRSCRCSMAGV